MCYRAENEQNCLYILIMALLTLSATTRRVATGKGNFSKVYAKTGNQFPPPSTCECTQPRVEGITALQQRVQQYVIEWYAGNGERVLDLTSHPSTWSDVVDLAAKLYDPVLTPAHQPSTLCHSASVAAATFAALGAAVEEKLQIWCGDDENPGVLGRASEFSVDAASPTSLTDLLLSNDAVSDCLSRRINKWINVQRKDKDSIHDQTAILNRRNKLMRAPLPHRPDLFEKFGGSSDNRDSDASSTNAAGTTNASDMHSKLVNHVLKVAFRKSGPRGRYCDSLNALQETHAVTRYLLSHFNGSTYKEQSPQNTSVIYCDYYDFKAYQLLPENLKRSSIVPGSYDMRDLPFRPFVIPTSYNDTEFFKYDRAVPVEGLPVSFDYGEFMCYYIFGLEWDKHLGDVVDALAHSPMDKFSNGRLKGVYKDLNDYNRLGHTRMGVADFALRSVAEFIRANAYAVATDPWATASAEEAETYLQALKNIIRRAVIGIRNFMKDSLREIVTRFKRELPAGDYGEEGEFECLVAHLFLGRLSDESHILRNTDIQRTVHATHINLHRRQLSAEPPGTKLQTYNSLEEVPVAVLDGLSGTATSTHDIGFYGNGAVISWDGSSNRVIGVWRNMTIRPDADILTHNGQSVILADKIKAVLKETSERGGLNHVFFSRENLYRALNARGIMYPGANLTEYRSTFVGKTNENFSPDLEIPLSGHSIARIAFAGELRGFFSGFRDILETKALTTLTRDAAEGLPTVIKSETQALRSSEGIERGVIDSLCASFERDSSLGLEFAEDTNAVTIKSTNNTLLEEVRALRANERAFSSVMRDMGVEVSEEVDSVFAAEMRETYPDAVMKEWDDAMEDFQKSIPESQIQKLEEIENEVKEAGVEASLEGVSEKINDTELAKATDTAVGKKLGNGFSMFMGRFGATVVIGSAVIGGFLGPAAFGMMHASRGAHLNIINHGTKAGVIAYKLVDFSCEDRTLGWAKRAGHPFREEIDEVIHNNADFGTHTGAFVRKKDGQISRYRAHAPICGEEDAKVSSCGSWATFDEPRSVLPWVARMSDMEKGTSLTCDKGMTVAQAVVSSILSLGADVANKIFEVLEDAVVSVAERTFSAVINSPALIIGVPLIVGLAATRLQMGNWKTGLIAAVCTLALILVIRFFAGSGPFTLNWFGAGNGAKRKTTEVYDEMGSNHKRRKLASLVAASDGVQESGVKWRPTFLPATTNYTRSARIIGRDVPGFSECYKQLSKVMKPTNASIISYASSLSPPVVFDMDSSGVASFSPAATSNSSHIDLADINLLPDVDSSDITDGVSVILDAGIPDEQPPLTRTERAIKVFAKPSPRVYVLKGNVAIPDSFDSHKIAPSLERAALVSVHREGGGGLQMDVFNTHQSDSLYMKIIPGDEEYNNVPQPLVVTVSPRQTATNTVISVSGEGRRVVLSCSWGVSPTKFIPASIAYDLHKAVINNKNLRLVMTGVMSILQYANERCLEFPFAKKKDTAAFLLNGVATVAAYLKTCGLPSRVIANRMLLPGILDALSDSFDITDLIGVLYPSGHLHVTHNADVSPTGKKEREGDGGDIYEENVEADEDDSDGGEVETSDQPPTDGGSSSINGEISHRKMDRDIIRILKAKIAGKDYCLFDMAIALGLFYYAPALESLVVEKAVCNGSVYVKNPC